MRSVTSEINEYDDDDDVKKTETIQCKTETIQCKPKHSGCILKPLLVRMLKKEKFLDDV